MYGRKPWKVSLPECMPFLHPIDEALLVGKGQVAGRIGENDGIILFQVFGTELVQAFLQGLLVFRLRRFGGGWIKRGELGLILLLSGLEFLRVCLVFGSGLFVGVGCRLFRLLRRIGPLGHLDCGLLRVIDGERAALFADLRQDRLRRLDRIVPESRRDGDNEHFFRCRRRAENQAARGESQCESAKN